MQIEYKNKKIKDVCTSYTKAQKKLGVDMAIILHQRIKQISSADSVETLIKGRIGRCHALDGKRKDQYAMDLGHPHRLIFIEIDKKNKVVKIIEIKDYH